MIKKASFPVFSRSGSVIILVAFGGLFLLGMVALVMDVGWMYFNKNRLQTGVNAAWKAGFDEVTRLLAQSGDQTLSDSDKAKVCARVRDIFQKNGFYPSEAASLTIQFSGTATNAAHLEVKSDKSFGLFFANLLDVPTAVAHASRGDNLIGTDTYDDGGGEGVVPLAIHHGDIVYGSGPEKPLDYYYRPFTGTETFQAGVEYILRMGESNKGGNSGFPLPDGYDERLSSGGQSNDGSLRFENGNGKSVWGDNFVNGYMKTLNLNDRLETEPGTAVGPVNTARDTRISNKDRRIILPIIDLPPEQQTTAPNVTEYNLSGKSIVRVTGFAIFDVTPTDENDNRVDLGDYCSGQIRGKFIRYIINPTEVASGVIY